MDLKDFAGCWTVYLQSLEGWEDESATPGGPTAARRAAIELWCYQAGCRLPCCWSWLLQDTFKVPLSSSCVIFFLFFPKKMISKDQSPSQSFIITSITGPTNAIQDHPSETATFVSGALRWGSVRPCEVTIAKHQGLYGQDAMDDGGGWLGPWGGWMWKDVWSMTKAFGWGIHWEFTDGKGCFLPLWGLRWLAVEIL